MRDRGRLKAAVYVKDPTTYEELILLPGDSLEPEIAALVTNPDAWDVPPPHDGIAQEQMPDGEPDLAAEASTSGQEPGQADGPTKKAAARRARSSSA